MRCMQQGTTQMQHCPLLNNTKVGWKVLFQPKSLGVMLASLPSVHFILRLHLQLDEVILKVPNGIALNTKLAMRKPVAHELKPVVRSIVDIVVFEAHILEQLHEVKPRSGVDCGNGSVDLAILEPRPTSYGIVSPEYLRSGATKGDDIRDDHTRRFISSCVWL
jgi:hypothetical protein